MPSWTEQGWETDLSRTDAQTFTYSIGATPLLREVATFTVSELFVKYGPSLWEDGRHKENVKSFLGEIDEILHNHRFSKFSQDTLDGIIEVLRKGKQQCHDQPQARGPEQTAAQGVQDGGHPQPA